MPYMFLTTTFQLSQKVGEKLNHEPIKLRFFSSNPQGHPKGPLKRALNQSVWDIIQPVYSLSQPSLLFYERLDVSIIELETKRSLKVVWTGIHNKEEVRSMSCIMVSRKTPC